MLGKIHQLLREYWPLFSFIVLVENGFRSLSFEKISVLDSYFVQRYIIIQYRSSLISSKIYELLWQLWPFYAFIYTAMFAL